MKFELKLFSKLIFLSVVLTGIALSTVSGILTGIKLNVNNWIIPALIFWKYSVSVILAYILSSQKTYVFIDKYGIKLNKHGLINWNKIDSYFYDDTSEFKTLKLRLIDNRKCEFVSRMNNS